MSKKAVRNGGMNHFTRDDVGMLRYQARCAWLDDKNARALVLRKRADKIAKAFANLPPDRTVVSLQLPAMR